MSRHRDNPALPAPDRFADRVMAVIADEPVPTPTRTLLSATRSGSMRDAASAVWVAWHLATVRRGQIDLRVRARSFALVLAVTAVLGTASVAGAAALRGAAEPIIDLLRPGLVELAPLEQPPGEAGPTLDEDEETDQDDVDATGDEDPDSDRSDDTDDEDEHAVDDPEDVDPGDDDSDVESSDDGDDRDSDQSDEDADPGDEPDEDVHDGSDTESDSDTSEPSTD